MKKTFYPLSISIVFQLLGVVINGIVGNGFEMLAHVIDTFNGKSSSSLFLQKLLIIVLSQFLINWIFADHSMAADLIFWITEKSYKTIWSGIEMWMTVGHILFFAKTINIKIDFQYPQFILQGKQKSQPKECELNRFRIFAASFAPIFHFENNHLSR